MNFANFTDIRTTTHADRTYRHDDPYAGLTFHLDRDTNFRLSGGSAATVPYAELVSGGSLVNRKQLDGATSIPYTQAYAEFNLRLRSGLAGSFGANYTGTNNWTNGPAFAVFNSMLSYDFKRGYRARLSVANLFNQITGNEYAAGDAGGGFASVNYGSRSVGELPTYGATPTTRFAIAPRTLRFQIEAHVGP